MGEYVDRFKTPIGILTIVSSTVWIVLAMYFVLVQGESFGPALIMTQGLVYSILVTFALVNYFDL